MSEFALFGHPQIVWPPKFRDIIVTQIIAIINVSNRNFWYSLIRIIINIVDKFKKKKADLSPDTKIRTSTKINKNPIK